MNFGLEESSVDTDSFISFMRKLRERCRQAFVPAISEKCGRFLKILAQMYSSQRERLNVLEIGTGLGYSTLWIAKGLIDSNVKGKIYTIEVDSERAKRAVEVLREANEVEGLVGVLNIVEVICGDAKEIIPGIGIPLDFVFIDAKKTEYLTYLKLVEPLLNRNGIVIADNAISHKTLLKDFLDEITSSPMWETVIIPIDEGFSLSIKVK